jgi:hypothetical protein
MACSSNAILSAAATKPWVGRTQAVGQRVIPLVRMNSATASQSFSGMIHPASSRIIRTSRDCGIRRLPLFVMIGRSTLCDGMYPFVSMGKMVNGNKMVNATKKSAGFA